jgi:hypothetical protein
LTAKEKEALETQIVELQKKTMTQEELARQESERTKKIAEEREASLTSERDTWKRDYTEYRQRTEIFSAASTNDAYSATQIVDLLMPRTKLVERKDDSGQPIAGAFDAIVEFEAPGKDGKPVSLQLPVAEAIKKMKELPQQYGNLFKSGVTGGLGAHNNGGPGKGTQFRSDMTEAEYQEYRKQQGFVRKV